MGTETKAVLSYGIIIPKPKIMALLHELRKRGATDKGANEEVDDDDDDVWSELAEELYENLSSHLDQAKLKEDFHLQTLSDDDWLGHAMLYRGKYSGGLPSNGMTVDTWEGEQFMPLVPGPWENKKLIEDANEAFLRLKEDSLFKHLQIEVNPQWLLGVSSV